MTKITILPRIVDFETLEIGQEFTQGGVKCRRVTGAGPLKYSALVLEDSGPHKAHNVYPYSRDAKVEVEGGIQATLIDLEPGTVFLHGKFAYIKNGSYKDGTAHTVRLQDGDVVFLNLQEVVLLTKQVTIEPA